MTGGSHIVIGVAAGLAVNSVYHVLPNDTVGIGFALAANVLGSLAPDIDSDESTIRQVTGTARHSGCLGALVSLVMRLFGGHRAVTHTLAMLALIAAVSAMIGSAWAIAFAVGYAAHLLADMLTRSGLPLLWPLTDRRLHLLPKLLRVRTGSAIEYLLTVAVGVGIYRLWQLL